MNSPRHVESSQSCPRTSLLAFASLIAICLPPAAVSADILLGPPAPPVVVGGQTAQVQLQLVNFPSAVLVELYVSRPDASVSAPQVVLTPNVPSFVSIQTVPGGSSITLTAYAPGLDLVRTTTLTVLEPAPVSASFEPSRFVVGERVRVRAFIEMPPGPRGGEIDLLLRDPSASRSIPDDEIWFVEPVPNEIAPGENFIDFFIESSPEEQPRDYELVIFGEDDLRGSLVVPFSTHLPRPTELLLYPSGPMSVPAGSDQTVVSGDTIQAEVILDGNAIDETGDITVTITEDIASSGGPPTLTDLPLAVTIPEGEDRVRFSFKATSRFTEANGFIIASTPTGSTEAELEVLRARLDMLRLPPSVYGGQTATGSILLTGAAAEGAFVATFSSDNPNLVAPNAITITDDLRVQDFAFSTLPVDQPQTATLTANVAGAAHSMSIELLPGRRGDCDGDRDIDALDFSNPDRFGCFTDCLNGPDFAGSLTCRTRFDYSNDFDVDLSDFYEMQRRVSGPIEFNLPGPDLYVDTSLVPSTPELNALSGTSGLRPVAVVEGLSGIRAEIISNELLVAASNQVTLSDFLSRWPGSSVLSEFTVPTGVDAGTVLALVRVDPQLGDVNQLPERLKTLIPNQASVARVSHADVLGLLAIAAVEVELGLVGVSINPLVVRQDFFSRSTAEDPINPTSPANYQSDAYCWEHLTSGSVQDIGVGEAWRLIAQAGLLGPAVPVGIIDGGFDTSAAMPNPDWPPTVILPDPSTNARTAPNPLTCSGGGACPWHGSDVISAGFAIPDNGSGSAGPGGPVSNLAIYVFPNGSSDLLDLISLTFTVLRDIASDNRRVYNISATTTVPAPFDFFTNLLNGFVRNAAADAVIVASAGNAGRFLDTEECFGLICWETSRTLPCEFPDVTCVGGLDANSRLAHPSSNFGRDVDIWAPWFQWVEGVNLPGGTPNLNVFSGTSSAAPFTAGIVALVIAADPILNGDQIRATLLGGAQTTDFGRPMVDAERAVEIALGAGPIEICVVSPAFTCAPGYPGLCTSVTGPSISGGSVTQLVRGTPARYEVSTKRRGRTVNFNAINYTWRTAAVGVMGTGNGIIFGDLPLGLHEVFVDVFDTQRGTLHTRSFMVNVFDPPPIVTITRPLQAQPIEQKTYCSDEPILFTAAVFDRDRTATPTIEWLLNGSTLLGTGQSLTTTIPVVGTNIVTARATDSSNQVDLAIVEVQILPAATCEFLEVFEITKPNMPVTTINTTLVDANGPFALVDLDCIAIDPEQGQIPDSRITWTAIDVDNPGVELELGTGRSLSDVRFDSTPVLGRTYAITVTVLDNSGNTFTRSVTLSLSTFG